MSTTEPIQKDVKDSLEELEFIYNRDEEECTSVVIVMVVASAISPGTNPAVIITPLSRERDLSIQLLDAHTQTK